MEKRGEQRNKWVVAVEKGRKNKRKNGGETFPSIQCFILEFPPFLQKTTSHIVFYQDLIYNVYGCVWFTHILVKEKKIRLNNKSQDMKVVHKCFIFHVYVCMSLCVKVNSLYMPE